MQERDSPGGRRGWLVGFQLRELPARVRAVGHDADRGNNDRAMGSPYVEETRRALGKEGAQGSAGSTDKQGMK